MTTARQLVRRLRAAPRGTAVSDATVAIAAIASACALSCESDEDGISQDRFFGEKNVTLLLCGHSQNQIWPRRWRTGRRRPPRGLPRFPHEVVRMQ